jgi:thiamine monophosphate kinase
MADASKVRFDINSGQIPTNTSNWRSAVSDGEDYELLLTASDSVPSHDPHTRTPITRIGTVSAGSGCFISEGESLINARDLGWEHS